MNGVPGAGSGDAGRRDAFESAWRRRFSRFAEEHDDDAAIAGWTPTGLETRLRHFKRHFGDRAEGLWLDAGCGAGTYTRHLAVSGARVVAVDYSLPSVAKAMARDDHGGLYAAADVTRLPFADAAFDGALCFGVTQALSGSEAAVAALARVLRPGGQIWVDALNAHCLPNLAAEAKRRLVGGTPRLRYETPRRLADTVRRQAVDDVEVIWLPILPTRWQRFQRLLESRFATALFRRLPWVASGLSHSFVVRGVKRRGRGPMPGGAS